MLELSLCFDCEELDDESNELEELSVENELASKQSSNNWLPDGAKVPFHTTVPLTPDAFICDKAIVPATSLPMAIRSK